MLYVPGYFLPCIINMYILVSLRGLFIKCQIDFLVGRYFLLLYSWWISIVLSNVGFSFVYLSFKVLVFLHIFCSAADWYKHIYNFCVFLLDWLFDHYVYIFVSCNISVSISDHHVIFLSQILFALYSTLSAVTIETLAFFLLIFA